MEEEVILYTINCPKCIILEKELDKKGIKYIRITNKNIMLSLGFKEAPMLKVGDKIMKFNAAYKWATER